MHVALFFWGRLPVVDYGGTQRMVVCLARGLAEAGHRVSLLAAPGSQVPEATLVPVDPVEARRPDFAIAPHLPKGMDLLLSYVQVRRPPGRALDPPAGGQPQAGRVESAQHDLPQ